MVKTYIVSKYNSDWLWLFGGLILDSMGEYIYILDDTSLMIMRLIIGLASEEVLVNAMSATY